MIRKIRETLGAAKIDTQGTDSSILRHIQAGEMEDSKILEFIENQVAKGKTSKDALIKLAKKMVMNLTRL